MEKTVLTVRPLQESDIDLIADYWLLADSSYLEGMGVDLSRLPRREEWHTLLQQQLQQPLEEKASYCLIWLADGNPVGHSNINKIVPRKEAYMHLHLWNEEARKKGWGSTLVKLSLPLFFEAYDLKRLYCEPYAHNPAPNKALARLGFELLRSYTGTPGWINFEQEVNLWCLSHEMFLKTYQHPAGTLS